MDVVTGGHYLCALLSHGALKCWGYNYIGQLGLGDNQGRGHMPGQMGDSLMTLDLGCPQTLN